MLLGVELSSRRCVTTVLLFSILALSVAGLESHAQTEGEQRKTLEALPIHTAITLDGTLDEDVWTAAPAATDFLQAEPHEGTPATENTEVRVLFDNRNLYFGVHCWDSNVQEIALTSRRRDFDSNQSDSFALVISTYDDNQTGYLFAVTPEAAQRDVQISQNGEETVASWDVVWDVKTTLHAEGWTAEIQIPFAALHYSLNNSNPEWGINFNRLVRHKNEDTFWSLVPRRFNLSRVSYSGLLTGLEEFGQSRHLRIKPYILPKLARRHSTPNERLGSVDIGADMKYELTPGLTLDLTVNTDFAETDVDEQQVNLNRFRLFFPEKRDFFVENSGIFYFGVRPTEKRGGGDPPDVLVFHSRRIGLSDAGQPIPILGGVRLTGHVNRFNLGIMHMQTQSFESLPSTGFTVSRIKMDVFDKSDVGAIFVQRASSRPQDTNRVFGLDSNFRFFENLTFTNYLAKSQSPDVHDRDWSSKVALGWKGRLLEMRGTYIDVGENFNTDAGFTVRKGVRTAVANPALRLRPRNNRWLREIYPHVIFQYKADRTTNQLLTRRQHYAVTFYFHDGGSFEVFANPRFERLFEATRIAGISIPAGDYPFNEVAVKYGSDRSKWLSGTLENRRSTFYGGFNDTQKASLTWRRKDIFLNTISVARNDITLPWTHVVTFQFKTRVGYAFSTRAYLDAYLQYENESREIATNIRFRYEYAPLSDIFLVYNEGRSTLENQPRDWSLSFKLTRLLQF